jgi:hypothetical protein
MAVKLPVYAPGIIPWNIRPVIDIDQFVALAVTAFVTLFCTEKKKKKRNGFHSRMRKRQKARVFVLADWKTKTEKTWSVKKDELVV